MLLSETVDNEHKKYFDVLYIMMKTNAQLKLPSTSAQICELVSSLSWRYFIKNQRAGREECSGG